jgi:hypothetical protein
LVSATEIQWQKTIIVIKTIEVSAFLIAVDRIVGGVDVDDELLRRLVVGFDFRDEKGWARN